MSKNGPVELEVGSRFKELYVMEKGSDEVYEEIAYSFDEDLDDRENVRRICREWIQDMKNNSDEWTEEDDNCWEFYLFEGEVQDVLLFFDEEIGKDVYNEEIVVIDSEKVCSI